MLPRRFFLACFPFLALSLTFAGPALSTDGVLEISQACADQTGCFTGDSPGLPVTIDGSGGKSYRLTSDLKNASPSVETISISTGSITLDLGGFEISGPNYCSGTPAATCTHATGEELIGATGSVGLNRIHDGSVRGAAGGGMLLTGRGNVVEDLRVSECGDDGIQLADVGGVVRRVIAERNLQDGIDVDANSLIESSTASHNGGMGMEMDDDGGIIRDSTAFQNALHGIRGSDGALILGNSSYENTLDGIRCISFCRVQSNTASSNGAYGLNFLAGTGSSYGDNTLSNNATGKILGGTNAGGNVCGLSLCP